MKCTHLGNSGCVVPEIKRSAKHVSRSLVDSMCSETPVQAGITLIEVPYWWDFQKESLAATINQMRSVFEFQGNLRLQGLVYFQPLLWVIQSLTCQKSLDNVWKAVASVSQVI